MSLSRIWVVLRKDLALGPRSPVFLYAIVLPVVLTAVFQLAFGSLFEPAPRLAIADDGDSAVTAELRERGGIELTMVADAAELVRAVEANDFDAGLVLPAGFDDALQAGERPELELYVSGESYASNRIILSVTTLDVIRQVEGSTPPVRVDLVEYGAAELPISLRLVPLLMMYALFIAGMFVPASSIVDEKLRGTLTAVLVTPARTSEVLVAKGAFGVILATLTSVVTLALNDALTANVLSLLLVVLLGTLFAALLGVLIGSVAKDGAMLFTIVKSSGILLFGPVIFYLFPEWPQWVAKLFPTYWVIDPIWRVSVLGDGLGDVWGSLAIAAGIALVMLWAESRAGRRMTNQLAAAN